MTVLNFFVAKLVTAAGQRKASVYLRYKYAEGNDEKAQDLMASEASLTAFCFPLGPDVVVPKEYMAAEEYTFTLTGGDGRRYQGFCRKFLPPKPAVGSKLQMPQVMCLVSEDPWHAFFFKVLQVLEQLVKSADQLIGSDNPQLPAASLTARFLHDLGTQLALNPKPSEVVKLALPAAVDLLGVGPQRMIDNPLALAEQALELQVPIDCANGRWNCGISLARLLWTVPPACLTTLLAAMLLERRIVLTSFQRDTVTAAVQAASALLYPFKWHHIYLPMLPSAFKDYLSAPMPFMVGLPGQMLSVLSSIPMDDTVVIDLDLGTCKPMPGSHGDDARGLPWREQLETALAAAHKRIRSPTEHETSPLIAGILQEYFVKLFGSYRRFIHSDSPAHSARFSPQQTHHQHGDKLHHVPNPSPGNGHHHTSLSSPRPRRESSFGLFSGSHHSNVHVDPSDRVIKGSGYVFEHAAFIHSHRRNPKVQQFLASLRGSQMYAQFIQERLEMAAAGKLEDSDEPFEQRLDRYQERRKQHALHHRSSRTSPLTAKWYHNIKRHRRTDSEEQAMMTRSMDASIIESLPSGTGSMRRIVTDPHSLAPSQGTSDIDPATFFPIEDDDEGLIGEEMVDDTAASEHGAASLLATRSSGAHSTAHSGDVRNHTLQSAPSQQGPNLEAPSLSFSDRSSNNTLFRQELQAHSFHGQVGRQSSDAVVLQRYLQQAKLLSSPTKQPQAGPSSHGHILSPIPSTESPPIEGKFKTMMKGALHDIKDVFTRRSQNGSVQGASSSHGGVLVNSASFHNHTSHHTPPHSSNNPTNRVSGGGYRRQVTGSDGPANRNGGFFSKYVPQLTGDQQPGRGLLSKYVPQLTGGNGLGSGHVSVLDVARGLLNKPPAPSRPVSACSTPQMPQRPSQTIDSPSHTVISPFVTPNDTAAWPVQPQGTETAAGMDQAGHGAVPCNLHDMSVPAPPEYVQQQGADKQGTESGDDSNADLQDGSCSSVGPGFESPTTKERSSAPDIGSGYEITPLIEGVEDGFTELAGRNSSHTQPQSAPQLNQLQNIDHKLSLLDM